MIASINTTNFRGLLMQESVRALLKTLAILLLLASLLLIIKSYIKNELNVDTPFVVVEGYSMLPTLYNGDIVIVYKPPPDDIKVGDILVYQSLRGELVIHRVVGIKTGPQCNPVCYVTKGDNNPIDDVALSLQPYPGISYDEVVGVVYQVNIGIDGRSVKVPLRIPYLGLLTFITQR